ncbi:MAG: glycosyltransferase [Ignavibacteria bacterium]|nr:glycosyltransferase [Ignavibacteria bacterium]
MKKGFSIIVCCYNSSELLRETIRSLCSLIYLKDFSAEIIIIDNASTDNTADIASGLLKEFESPFEFRIEYESKQGLSFARKKGIEVSGYDYILFCDDDNRLDENYLINSFRLMEGKNEIGALGGVSEPVSDIIFPDWFEDFKQSYSAGRQSESNGEIISELHSLWGAGLVLRRTAIEGLYNNGFHSLLSDRTGSSLTSGGDTELCYALRLAGWKIWFDDSLKLKHFLPGKKTYLELFKRAQQRFRQTEDKL